MKFKLNKPETQNYSLLGIVSPETDYKVSWAINESLNISLSRAENFVVSTTKGQVEIELTCYIWQTEEYSLQYILIQNKAQGALFLDEFKNIDYFLLIIPDVVDIQLITTKLKSSKVFQTILLLNNTSIKRKDHIVQVLSHFSN